MKMKAELSLFSKPGIVADYAEWLEHPMTVLVLSAVRDNLLRPIIPGYTPHSPVISRESCEFSLGENAGSWKVFDAIQNMTRLQQAPAPEPEESYPMSEK